MAAGGAGSGVHLAADGATTAVLAAVGRFLHRRRDEAVRAEQVPLQALVGEEAALALLAVERRPVVDHLRVDFDLVDPLHVVAQLLQVLHTKANQNSLNQVHIKGHRPKEYSVCKT